MTENTRLGALIEYAKQAASADHSGHGFDHIQRVAATTRKLLAETPEADPSIALAAAILHDTYDDKLVADPAVARAKTQAELAAVGDTPDTQELILAIIDHMSFKSNLDAAQPLPLEGQLVQDADRLDALGAIGIARAFMFGGAHGSVMYDPDIAPRETITPANYREAVPVINHFYEKLLRLPATMNTEAGKRLAMQRAKVMQDFLAEFKAEWHGEA
ncbi:HD domain-containing protein [Lacticaseibacillus yichunensis]|uniref:HD domain-containing protein n=1 Tax=Lacticaseibacillus yichunensis TaxID=2486015 RepID=A0ABW4CPK0_9LACO|nr:HD domain-containing protein [Lacticaseibacillus yichunensis]